MSNDNGHSATDIITYIGVPLAVLGVLPILYNTVVTLLNASKIKRTLRHSRLTALTRSDVVNRIIEIELPRYAVTPWDRFEQPAEYWSLPRNPSAIPGGSWTTFHWKTNAIGFKTQRLEYADQLRQPQVEVSFAELVCYLLDLGAVPEPQGWRLLRSTGLWTPAGCALMKSPDGHHNALSLAPLDDSEGNLSLSVTWQPAWTTRSASDLPPYWVSLPAEGAAEDKKPEAAEDPPIPANDMPATPTTAVASRVPTTSSLRKASLEEAAEEEEAIPDNGAAAAATTTAAAAATPISCQISVDGVVAAMRQGRPPQGSLSIEHLRVRTGQTAGTWFASAATAYGTTGQTVLWSYRIPDDVVAFARRETVPCGVLVLLGFVDEAATPEWASKHPHDQALAIEQHMRIFSEQRAAEQAEARMPPAQREMARRERQAREGMQRMQEMRDRMRRDADRRDQRDMEALQSPKWDARLVADHSLCWLRRQDAAHAHADHTLDPAALLHRMVRDPAAAATLCAVLDRWKAWADIGGMKSADLQALRHDPRSFAEAALLVALIRDSTAAAEGTVSMDLQECLRMWHKVRLG